MSLSSSAVRMILRPMRPKPLMPTLMGITSSDEVSEIAAAQKRVTAAGEQKMLWVARTKVNARIIGECKPPLWCLTKCGDWRYSSCVSCSVNTTRRRLLHVTNFTRTARSKRCRYQSGPCQDRGYAPGISERDVRKVWKADLSLCQVRIARTRSELAFDADRGRQDRGPEDPLRTSGRAIKAAGGRVQALS